jgi:hypothetical protein
MVTNSTLLKLKKPLDEHLLLLTLKKIRSATERGIRCYKTSATELRYIQELVDFVMKECE